MTHSIYFNTEGDMLTRPSANGYKFHLKGGYLYGYLLKAGKLPKSLGREAGKYLKEFLGKAAYISFLKGEYSNNTKVQVSVPHSYRYSSMEASFLGDWRLR